MTTFIFALAITINSASIWFLVTRRIRRLEDTLDRVRMATYELTTMAQDDINDLRDAVKAAGIDVPRPRMRERMRREALSPEERHRESMEKWEATVAEFEERWRS